jgi:mono/diheme cytochrome c family protein
MKMGAISLSLALVLVGAVAGVSYGQNQGEGKKLYTNFCASCHGDTGKGDGPAGRALPARPADHTNGAVMNQMNDKFIVDIITKGGSVVGKSSFMPAWGGSLNDNQIRDVVAYIRSLAVPRYKPESQALQ